MKAVRYAPSSHTPKVALVASICGSVALPADIGDWQRLAASAAIGGVAALAARCCTWWQLRD
ncbi:hypothetical protein [Streptomyces sp. RPT161]|uniref:hypothetical protein n=1 Tax=Streptomyces sp. RPT161 TaxID=3015993 RepID=UPI0022B92A43|nr:hypothetical protein [Streptomyces sp. RPT161]